MVHEYLKDKPNLTFNFLNYLNSFNLKEKICLEIGAGESTIYWSNLFKKVISYENDLIFLTKLKKKCKNISNIKLFNFDKNIFNKKKFKKNVELADYIIIDNNPNFIDREKFCIFVNKNKNKKSLIVLDNGTWNLNAYNYMLKNYFCMDFPGKNKDNEITVTSLFFKKKTHEYMNYTKLENIVAYK
jgi:hypothetical protein